MSDTTSTEATAGTPAHSNPAIDALEKKIEILRGELNALRKSTHGGPMGDYPFVRSTGEAVKLSELFAGKDDLLIVHNMGERCQYCALWADGFIGFSRHLRERCSFVLASPDSPASLTKQISLRGWNFPVVSDAGTTFAHDCGYEPKPGTRWAGVSSFHLDRDASGKASILRVTSSQFGPGDEFCSIWHMFDMLKDGVKGWQPKKPGE